MQTANTQGATDQGWLTFGEGFASGEVWTLAIWALVAYLLWSLLSSGPRNGDGGGGGWFGDCDDGGDGGD
ncbi:MAG: hypothetical protein ACP5EN_14975 [Rhodovulum sp.]